MAVNSEQKPSNPKDLIGSDKLPLHLWPQVATAYGSLGLLDGMLKYGRANFRAIGVRASIYKDALDRHMGAWFEGEDNDPDSGLPHLAHALACLAILVDAESSGKLTDDRQYPGGYRQTMTELTPHVKRLKALRAAAAPERHYTIQDDPWEMDLENVEKFFTRVRELMSPDIRVTYDDDEAMEDLLEDDPEYWGV